MVGIEAAKRTQDMSSVNTRATRPGSSTIIETYAYEYDPPSQKLQIKAEIRKALKYVDIRLYMAELPFVVPELVCSLHCYVS